MDLGAQRLFANARPFKIEFIEARSIGSTEGKFGFYTAISTGISCY